MARRYREIAATHKAMARPSREDFMTFYAYKKGKCVAEEKSRDAAIESAKLAGIDGVTIEKDVDGAAYAVAMKLYNDYVSAISKEWYDEVREDHSYLNDETFKLVYDKAYSDGHSCGHDEVQLYIDDIAEFAQKIIEANKS